MSSVHTEISNYFDKAAAARDYIQETEQAIADVIKPYNDYFRSNRIKYKFIFEKSPVPYQTSSSVQYLVALQPVKAGSVLTRFFVGEQETEGLIRLNMDGTKRQTSYFNHPHRLENHSTNPIDDPVAYVQNFASETLERSIRRSTYAQAGLKPQI